MRHGLLNISRAFFPLVKCHVIYVHFICLLKARLLFFLESLMARGGRFRNATQLSGRVLRDSQPHSYFLYFFCSNSAKHLIHHAEFYCPFNPPSQQPQPRVRGATEQGHATCWVRERRGQLQTTFRPALRFRLQSSVPAEQTIKSAQVGPLSKEGLKKEGWG